MKKSVLVLLLCILILSACSQTGISTGGVDISTRSSQPVTSQVEDDTDAVSPITATPDNKSVTGSNWWQDAVFYELFVRSFKDSDGDGIGDFQGIIQMLDYLNDGDPSTNDDLGITAIWLMPINPSPSYHGYDVTNYMTVNPDYGTLDDFRQLLDEAHQRGIHVIMDFVINHTSDKHPWFVEAQNVESGFHDWYVWSSTNPSIAGPWGQNAWYKAKNDMFYYAIFWSGMPDLNYQNPQVNKMMFNITRYWLDKIGVDGFRVDAARYLYADGIAQQDTPETIAWFKDWREVVKMTNQKAFTVGEVWTDVQSQSRYGDGTGFDSLFMFDLSEAIINGIYSPSPLRIMGAYQDALHYFPDQQFSTFLTNHDQQRVMSFFRGQVDKAKLSAFIYLTGPGIPFIYYGEEIGMTGNKPDENLRKPMQWSAEPNGGFSEVKPWQTLSADYVESNVQEQQDDPGSLLTHYQQLIALRNTHPALRTGSYLPLETNCRSLYTVIRVEGDNVILTIVNIGNEELTDCKLSIASSLLTGNYQGSLLFGEAELSPMTFNADGSMQDYLLEGVLNPGQMLIFELLPN